MEENTVLLVILLGIIAVGIVGMVGLVKPQTGAASLESPGCWCTIVMHTYYGQSVVSHRQWIDTQTWLTPEQCQIRCDQFFPTDEYGVRGEAT